MIGNRDGQDVVNKPYSKEIIILLLKFVRL